MDIEARKLTVIEQFIKIQNMEIIFQFEKILNITTKKNALQKPFTTEEFNTRISKSMKNSKKGKLTTNNTLISEIEKWS